MDHASGLIATLAVGLGAAFVGGLLAAKLRLSPIIGYLLAGIAVGPFTPGFVANVRLAPELAEIGVILLMFGVGIHFSLRDLMAVRAITLPGAIVQIAAATALATGLALAWGWRWGAGLVFGLAISVASTVVLLRSLMEHDALETIHGRVAVGWLIVQDLFTVVILVLLPALAVPLGGKAQAGSAAAAGGGHLFLTLLLALGKAGLFVLLMLFIGARAVPWLLVQVARIGSRELFTLAVLAVALGVAYASAAIFGVSLALGAFVAGLVVGESDLSHQAAADALPMRDAFAVLFFVSVGMLFNPAFLLTAPGRILAVLAVIVLGNSLTALLFVIARGYPIRTALTLAAGLAQIGEFSFIVAGLGRSLGILPEEGYHLVLAGALITITFNPLLFRLITPVEAWLRRHPKAAAVLERRAGALDRLPAGAADTHLRGHAVICGYGRVGSLIGAIFDRLGFPYVVIEQSQRQVEALRRRGVPAYYGDAANQELLAHVDLVHARVLVIALPDPLATRRIVEHARTMNPDLPIVARTHSEQEWTYLSKQVTEVVLGEREAAAAMAEYTLRHCGAGPAEIQEIVQNLRARQERAPRLGSVG